MTSAIISLPKLRNMIGVHVRHRGMHCIVIEVLEDGPSLVLIDAANPTIQQDQYGSPMRKTPTTTEVPVLTIDGLGFHQDYLELDLLDE